MKNSEIKKYINQLYNYPTHLASARRKFLLKNEKILNACKKDLKKYPQWKNEKNILLGYFYEIENLLRCSICNKQMSIEKTLSFYLHHRTDFDHVCCSQKCKGELLHKNKDLMLQKLKETNLKKYGVENPYQSEQIKAKIKKKHLEKYGVQNPYQSEQIKEKIKQTNLKKYGVQHAQQSKQIKEKIKQTNLKKYGVVAPLQNDEIKEKSKKTCLEKYGVEYSMQNKDIQEKSKKTCLEKYGVEYTGASKARIEKILNNSWNTILLWKDIVIPQFTRQEWKGTNTFTIYKWKCSKCGNIFETNFIHTFSSKVLNEIPKGFENIPRCKQCYPILNTSSILEKELLQFCQQYFPNASNNKELISPYEIDILIPEKKLAIEFNGVYWHSDKYKDKYYHLNKYELCKEKGYKLIQIWQHNWVHNKELIKNRLKSLFGFGNIFYGRKCIIKEISINDKNNFLNTYHIQGEDKSSIRLGLYFENELVAVMTFGKPRFNKNYEYELIRYASKGRVIGGAGKLLKYFEKIYNPKNLITYADKCWSQGNLYIQLGFTRLIDTQPSYFWVKNEIVLSRYQTQKAKLKNILKEKFNSNISENDNMLLNGFYKIYDCGNLVFEKIYEN